jgi:multidrug transporter EmrE-like cation transporter
MIIWIIFVVYATMSATGLFLIKTGAENTSIAIENSLLNFQLSPRLLLGFAVYVCSFLLSVYLVSRMKLSVFYPLGTGSILILTSLLGFFVLKEDIGIWQLIGMGLILAGIIVINIRPV